ncbi:MULTISPECIES: phosphoserine transaminase [Acetobacter]|uniref:phosphoserine transaminase n=2 Tax=Acetobacter TaxID=434 RepID=A0A0U5EWN7_9PROT|nr:MULTISPECIES: phosphoserine transaminase [Acetobacter]KXV58059.1 phosphoserine aminotransferase [Acetobacter senegalensis]MCG4257915.1 phosphoserine transaminase [Acetobacter senegalensis]MCG4267842.1 phosphoserine transaminase [Acetobacter senegalensis]MCG4272320.1 phosphoserine transaminase [Acetobacter senegalensis]MCP1196736.1 phosphoserine transaminase [Acetobacter senegalensis]
MTVLDSVVSSRPATRPANPCFSSGPCAKRPGWSVSALSGALTGRSHRSAEGRARLGDVIERSRTILGVPEGWRIGIVPASDTGAVEMALWSLLGPRPVDVLAFESFSSLWAQDIVSQLKLENARVLKADYGALPALSDVNWAHDVVLAWNGTTSGVCLPSADVIPAEHDGLVICDATSAAFAMDLPWDRLDVVTWSWQKALGGEAAHGMLALSPRAVERLEQFQTSRPLPKIFRLMAKGALIEGIFKGDTINTPSMLCVEDALDSLKWAASVGGLEGLKARSRANLAEVAAWEARTDWVSFLAENPAERSSTSICLRIVAPWFLALERAEQMKVVKKMTAVLEKEGVAFDIASYRDAPPGLRIWGGATVEASDVRALLPWLDWAFAEVSPA